MNGLAHFVRFPNSIDDLRRPYLLDDRVSYSVARIVSLSRINYGNFINDLSVERRFLERHARRCRVGEDGRWHCLFVRHRRKRTGILVLPDRHGFVLWAAFLPGR